MTSDDTAIWFLAIAPAASGLFLSALIVSPAFRRSLSSKELYGGICSGIVSIATFWFILSNTPVNYAATGNSTSQSFAGGNQTRKAISEFGKEYLCFKTQNLAYRSLLVSGAYGICMSGVSIPYYGNIKVMNHFGLVTGDAWYAPLTNSPDGITAATLFKAGVVGSSAMFNSFLGELCKHDLIDIMDELFCIDDTGISAGDSKRDVSAVWDTTLQGDYVDPNQRYWDA